MLKNQFLLGIFILFSIISFGLYVRFRPLWINPYLGIDHWYWLLCAEDVKKRKRIPPKLPYFMLEIEEQWYPPLFSVLLALLPMKWLKEHGGKISQILDLFHLYIIFIFIIWFTNNLIITFLSCISYILAWFPLTYNTQLQPRVLANFILTLIMLMLWYYIHINHFSIWLMILITSLILFFLHKMTVQMWTVYILGFGAWAWDWKLLSLLPASILLAVVVSKGFYLKMLKAHWDVVSFWHKNINYLGSHQYYESPLYWKKDFVSTAFHQKGWRHQIKKIMGFFKYNPFVLVIPVLIYQAFNHPLKGLEKFLWLWLGITFIWSLLTTFVPYLLALGGGYYYIYQTFFPLFLLISLSINSMSFFCQILLFALWSLSLIYLFFKWEKYCRSIKTDKNIVINQDLIEVLNYLKRLQGDGVFCIPFTLPDKVAFWTRKKVFWGGHSYGFNSFLKPYFPIVREEIRETLKKKGLSYLIFWRSYLSSLEDIRLKEGEDIHYIFGKGEYELYEVIK